MDVRNEILRYLLEKYYQPNLSGEVARHLDMPEDRLIDQIALINREKNGLVILKESMGKNKYVISLRPNSVDEIKTFLHEGGFATTQQPQASPQTVSPPIAETSIKNTPAKTGTAFKWIAVIALLFSLAALGLAVYSHLLFGGYL